MFLWLTEEIKHCGRREEAPEAPIHGPDYLLVRRCKPVPRLISLDKLYKLTFFFLDNFVANIATPSVLQEEGNRLSPPGFPLGPVYVN